MNITRAVILAAGEGQRMRPLSYTHSKVMLPIANKPILEHLLVEMIAAGIREVILVVGYHDEQVLDYFGNGVKWNIHIQYADQRQQKGTADAVRMADGLFKDKFLLANGDIIINRRDIQKLTAQNGNTMSVVDLPDVTGLGVIDGQNGQVVRIYEKPANPPTHLANAGLYAFTPEIFGAIQKTGTSPRGEYEITDSIQILIDSGIKVAYQTIGEWPDLSYPWDLLGANEIALSKLERQISGEIEEQAIIQGAVSVGVGTRIRSGAYIMGPVIIGQNCDIGPNCFIRPSTAIGDNCHIGASVEVKNSIIMRGTKIPHLNYVGDSVIGENCNLGAGTKIANLKLDKKNIFVNDIDTKRRKLGAIIGDGVETGINASINVGTLIGNNARIGPGALAHGLIAPRSKIF
jgi:UDP-N-acetylglucosamine diphosphorylase/glucosamine-1-phosphate N-acetyltransferase